MEPLHICNSHGNVDVRENFSRSYVHVRGPRLQPICRRLGIRYAEALVGFSDQGRKARFGYKPVLDGVVVSARSAPRLLGAIEERVQRSASRPQPTKEQLAERRSRKQEREVVAFAVAVREQFPGCPGDEARRIASHACKVGSGRVGRTSSLATDDKVRCAVVAHVRHSHTDYEDLLDECYDDGDRDDARQAVGGQIRAVLAGWEVSSEVS